MFRWQKAVKVHGEAKTQLQGELSALPALADMDVADGRLAELQAGLRRVAEGGLWNTATMRTCRSPAAFHVAPRLQDHS